MQMELDLIEGLMMSTGGSEISINSLCKFTFDEHIKEEWEKSNSKPKKQEKDINEQKMLKICHGFGHGDLCGKGNF